MSETKRLTHCPETGRSLEGIDPRKHAANLWPTIAAGKRTEGDSEAYRRYMLLTIEADLRDAEAEDKRSAARSTKR
jgi:hypothetical protein